MSTFPRSDINPKNKDQQWFVQMAKAIWNDWQTIASKSFAAGAGRYNRIEYYAQGKQPADQYKPRVGVDDKDSVQWASIDWTPIPVLPKMIRIINSLFRKIRMIPDVSTVDPYSDMDKEDYYASEMANIKMRQILEVAEIDPSLMDSDDPEQPKNEEELRIKMDFKWKHNLTIAIEKGLDKFSMDIDFDEEREKVRESIIKKGAGGYKVSTEDSSGRVQARAVDLSAFICSATKDPYMRDIWYGGEITFVLISELRNQLGDQITEDQLEELAMKFRNQHGNPLYYQSDNTAAYSYDSARIPVLDLSFKNENVYLYEHRKLDNGNFVIGKADKRKQNYGGKRTYYEDRRGDVFKCKWVLDSAYVYGYGLENDMVKKASRYWDAALPYLMCAPNLHNMETSSIAEELIPIVDSIHIAWYKLQNVVAQARPKGIEIEIGALEDVPLADNGENLTPIQLLDLFNKRGIVVYRRVDDSGAVSNYSPIKELNNGLGTEAQEYFLHIERLFNMLKGMIGLNDLTDGSTPDERTLNGVASLAAEATNNALHHVFNAEKNLFERLFDNAACRIYDSIAFKNSSYYSDAFGKTIYESIKKLKKKNFREMGVKVLFAPNAQEKEKLEADANAAVAAGQITLADKYEIVNIDNVKLAQQILAYRIKKNLEEAHRREMEKIQATSQQQVQSAQMAEDEKRKTIQLEKQLELQLMEREYQLKAELAIATADAAGFNKDTEMQKKQEIQESINQTTRDVSKEKRKAVS
jgi:hypothetical protein